VYFVSNTDSLSDKTKPYFALMMLVKVARCEVSVNMYLCVSHVIFPMTFCSDYLALNVYIALCYYKLDYYDVSQVTFYLEF
jgi:hypothetical protein